MLKINQLRLEFEEKIKSDWESKWRIICNYDESKINRKAKFYEALAADITSTTSISVSRDTVQRFNKGEGGDSKPSLEAFSRYLGYKSYFDFENYTKDKSENNKLFKLIIGGLLVSFCFIMAYIFFIHPYIQKKEILAVIEKANKRQYEIFLNLNIADTAKIDSFYTSNDSARKGILTLLRQSQYQNRRIDVPAENPSYYKIHEKRVVDIDESNALVKTKEHWFLKWYDMQKKKYTLSYDHQNEQIYELKYRKGVWKIENNYFEGKATNIDF